MIYRVRIVKLDRKLLKTNEKMTDLSSYGII